VGLVDAAAHVCGARVTVVAFRLDDRNGCRGCLGVQHVCGGHANTEEVRFAFGEANRVEWGETLT